MDRKKLIKGAWAAGGAALLVGSSAACVKGMRAVDRHLRDKRDAEAMKAAEAELADAFSSGEEPEEAAPVQEPAE